VGNDHQRPDDHWRAFQGHMLLLDPAMGILPALGHSMKRDFDDLSRLYEAEKQDWIAKHPEATPQEYEQAMREIAKRIGF
jgi:hypothetical protein